MKFAVTLLMALSTSALVFASDAATVSAKEEIKAKVVEAKTKVNNSCSEDAAKAGCTGKEFGKGLMKCLHAYKKEHKDFKISDSCKSSTKEVKAEREQLKELKKQAHDQKSTEVKK